MNLLYILAIGLLMLELVPLLPNELAGIQAYRMSFPTYKCCQLFPVALSTNIINNNFDGK